MALDGLLLALVPLFVIVDPFASIGLYLGLTERHSPAERRAVAVKACLFAAVVLLLFAFLGRELLDYLGIQLYSLQVAGGLLLAVIGLNMLREGRELQVDDIPLPTGGSHPQAAPVRHDPSFVPLGLPMLAGPGAISLVIVQTTDYGIPTLGTAIALSMLGSLLVLLVAGQAQRLIGENGARVITRIMGLLTVAFAVQYVLDGIDAWKAAGGAS
ncbi:MAG TPA: MarC family protein [Candidatus Thermoplasmatota archaeon]|nr:MarC family protein [Candidatus Thermoplasmatota archaeon]